MALLSKKTSDAENNKVSPEKKSDADKSTQKSGLFGLILALTVFIVIAIAVSTGFQFVNSTTATQQHFKLMQEQMGKEYLNQLNTQISALQRNTDQVAAQESLLLTLQVADKSVISATEKQIQSILPYAVSVRISPLGRARLDANAEIPLTFAGLDMIKRQEKGQKVPLEFHRLNKRLYIEVISPILNDVEQIVGSLLVTYDTQSVLGSLSGVDSQVGQLTLEQKFSESSTMPIFQLGQGNNEGFAYVASSILPYIQLNYQLSSAQLAQPLVSVSAILIAGGIALIMIVFGVVLFSVVLNNRLNHNMHLLSEFTLSLAGGRKPKLPKFTIGQFGSLAQALFQMTRQKGSAMVDGMIESAPESFGNSASVSSGNDNEELELDLELDLDAADTDDSESEGQIISRQIFRAYDIRGRVEDQLTPAAMELIGQAIGSEAYDRGQQTLYVGYDGRLTSEELAAALAKGIQSTGRDVIDIGLVATPVVYFAAYTQESNSGVMITGSHNPPEYNGLKVVIDGEPLHDDAISHLYERIIDDDLLSGEGSYHKVNLNQEYIERIVSDIAIAQPLKVVVDAGNGVAGQYAPQLFEAISCDVVPLYCDVDGTFPNHHPDPTIESNLKDLIATVVGDKADLGIAFDGDGDRIVVIDDKGQLIQPDQLMMMFAKDVLSRCPGTDIVYDVKCSSKLGAYISQQGGRPVVWKSGHSLIKSKMFELGATLGGEMSGHLVFNERWYGFDDGLYAGARLLELLSADHRPVSEVFKAFPVGLLTPEYHIPTTEQHKFEVVAELKAQLNTPAATLTEIDGVRVDYDNGWGLVRASNTTPALTLRFEGDDEDALRMIQDQFKEALQTVDSSLQIPF